jgi:hypothetical protein
MNRKIRSYSIAIALSLIALSMAGQTVQAQTSESFRFSSPAYVPGDSGTITYFITNTAGNTISLKNLTIYFPWAGYDPSNKWQGNVSINFSPWKTLVTNPAGGNITYSNQVNFQVPAWFGALFQNHNCGNGRIRYGLYAGCMLIGTDQDNLYDSVDLSVAIAQAVYTPISLVSEAIPIATLIVLIFATAFLFMAWTNLRRLSKK